MYSISFLRRRDRNPFMNHSKFIISISHRLELFVIKDNKRGYLIVIFLTPLN